jgi:hypothetical protein
MTADFRRPFAHAGKAEMTSSRSPVQDLGVDSNAVIANANPELIALIV